MHGRPVLQSVGESNPSHPNRWRILGVLVLALLVTSIDHTIINVALPQLVAGLGASSADLQWIVASYTIVFAGLLLTAGSLGDRLGRRHALAVGLATFMAGSIASATATTTTALIVGRSVMGVGGALIMPTTLSILVSVFGDPRERAKAIAAWTAASGLGIALGPIAGGFLMRSFSWSSVFWINVPLLVIALMGTFHLVPDSRDPRATKLDPIGAVLSIVAIGTLVNAIIQAPADGWTSTSSFVAFASGTTIALLFVLWELRRDDPMLDMRLFANRSFSASSIALAMLFFAMSGTVFLQAQYLQFILGYTPLVAGFALVPAAFGMLVGTGVGAHMNSQFGGRVAVATGTLIAAAGVAVQAGFSDGSSYVPTGVGLLLFGLGAGIAMPAATDIIMATLPPARAGVGSAVNDTVRELGGALGVAVIGSIAATRYTSSLQSKLGRFGGVSGTERHLLTDNVGSALHVSGRLGANGNEIATLARSAFVDSMSASLWVAVGLALAATVVALRYLPRAQRHEHATHHHAGVVDAVAAGAEDLIAPHAQASEQR
jgi:EmrB/QacA subfamily drug resistance transporter